MPRLFVAIEFPPEVKQGLARLCTGVEGARWAKPDNLHLTLRFIGSVEEEHVDAIAAALAQVEASSFPLTLAGAGHFRGQTLWVGMADNPPLLRLQADIENALRQVGLVAETRPYAPHIKLASLRARSQRRLRSFLAANANYRGEPFTVRYFALIESHLSPAGAVHEPLVDYPLRSR